jgi:hypothetical protein
MLASTTQTSNSQDASTFRSQSGGLIAAIDVDGDPRDGAAVVELTAAGDSRMTPSTATHTSAHSHPRTSPRGEPEANAGRCR